MRHIQTSRFILIGLAALTALAANGCSSAEEAAAGCNGLDAKVQAQASVKAFADAAFALRDRAVAIEGQFLAVCNKINAAVGADTSKTTAEGACGVLSGYIQAQKLSVSVIVGGGCTIDAKAQAECEATCTPPSCDIEAECKGGEVVVACNGECSGSCDVQGPSVACQGSCEGECTSDVAVKCAGSCS
ncbi:MAG TPA: hypothetical protein VFQ61_25610, partial [Polyangiaceae bacterium]|nr:hypothetical protein [Polyangiaceae bacterium]